MNYCVFNNTKRTIKIHLNKIKKKSTGFKIIVKELYEITVNSKKKSILFWVYFLVFLFFILACSSIWVIFMLNFGHRFKGD